MKVAILCDTHFGARNDHPVFLEHFMLFFEEVFFPYLDKHGIKNVIHLGDLMDRRKYVNFQTLNAVRNRFIQPLWDRGTTIDIIPGNHDVYFKNTNQVNSIQELFEGMKSCDNWRVHHKPDYFNDRIALVPWITKDNEKECLDFISTTDAPILMGHFELNGYEVLRGVESHEGMDPTLLSKFDAVYSGHFHCKHSKGNVHYLGTQYQITFADLNEPKGFHVLDTETHKIEYVRNPHRIFTRLDYNDETTDWFAEDLSPYAKTFVKVVIEKKSKPFMLDRLIDRLHEAGCHSVSIADPTQTDKSGKSEEKVDMKKDTMTLICEVIDTMEGVDDPSRLKNLISELYTEALQT